MHYIGIDFHKESTHVVVLNEAGKLLERTRIPTRREELVRFFGNRPEPAKAALEATRNWYWAYDTIEPLVEELKLASPPKIRIIAESTVKTDHIDAKVIADLLRSNFLPTCYVPDAETRQKRELLRHRAFLVQIRTKVKNRIHIILDKLGIEHPFDNLFSKRGLEFLRGLELPWAYQKELTDSLELLEFLNGKEKEQNKVIEKLCQESEEAALLMTIPGIAYHNALLIMSEIGDVNRFATGTKFCGYCGLVPTVHISDKTVRYGQMTQVAIGAVAREMAVVSFYILKYRKPFRDAQW